MLVVWRWWCGSDGMKLLGLKPLGLGSALGHYGFLAIKQRSSKSQLQPFYSQTGSWNPQSSLGLNFHMVELSHHYSWWNGQDSTQWDTGKPSGISGMMSVSWRTICAVRHFTYPTMHPTCPTVLSSLTVASPGPLSTRQQHWDQGYVVLKKLVCHWMYQVSLSMLYNAGYDLLAPSRKRTFVSMALQTGS